MNSRVKKQAKRIILLLILGFILLFGFRLYYGYTLKTTSYSPNPTYISDFGSTMRQNIATKKYKSSISAAIPTATAVDQKYEKIADIRTYSSRFEEEEKKARQAIKNLEALIQYEMKNGNQGQRNLQLIIGVPPDNFDTLYSQLSTLGKIESKQITKKDKTNEYKELNAQKKSLEKTRQSLVDLKSKNGYIGDYITLENRILDIDQQLQALGVSLGDFDEENEFCTVKFALNERKTTEISLSHRIKVALQWTVKMYLQIMIILVLITSFAFLLVSTINRFKIIEALLRKDD